MIEVEIVAVLVVVEIVAEVFVGLAGLVEGFVGSVEVVIVEPVAVVVVEIVEELGIVSDRLSCDIVCGWVAGRLVVAVRGCH